MGSWQLAGIDDCKLGIPRLRSGLGLKDQVTRNSTLGVSCYGGAFNARCEDFSNASLDTFFGRLRTGRGEC